MKTQEQLLKNIIGQLQGVIKMTEQQQDCFAVLIQLKAAKSALNSVTRKFLQENLKKCLTQCKGNQEEVCNKFIAEIITFS